MPKVSPSKKLEIERKFKSLDSSGDGKLSLSELSGLLKKGNPKMKDDEILKLFKTIDKDHNSYVDFKEFLSFIFSAAEDSAPVADWSGATSLFQAFGGEDGLDSREFGRMFSFVIAKDCTVGDLDIVVTAICGRNVRRMTFTQFQSAAQEVASKKHMPLQDLLDGLTAEHKKVLKKTVKDGEEMPFSSTSKEDLATRHARLAAANQVYADPKEEAMDWDFVKDVYQLFSRDGRTMDVQTFKKLCADAGLFDGKFKVTDCDLLFSSLKEKVDRHINFPQFQDGLRKIAKKKGCGILEVQGAVMSSSGPNYSGTNQGQGRYGA
mmetsp:Transcript_82728/g.146047  ORF Transcript_82728/g.146047 Transcript_82728/m.146047 type:complete len:321 (+) Transcript_82728:34-996(+)